MLKRIEDLLRTALGRGSDFVLADYFDFVAGTSTGAIIATCIALRMPMDTIRSFYLDCGKAVFDRASLLRHFHYRYEDDKLAAKLQRVIGKDMILGSLRLGTLLMLVMRNASTDSPWLLSNNPLAKYNQRLQEDRSPLPDCNLDLPLWQLVRASTAAPTFFPPEVVRVGTRSFVLVDGVLTPYNNPAFIAFLMTTVDAYRQAIDCVDYLNELQWVGQAVAARHVRPEHFSAFLEDSPAANSPSGSALPA